ncbi:hypothetical protein [Bacillus pseudomycoides]|uniref:YhfM-like domain-containing protein n=1 Tax=Bacillus pseudomycoides TaxID=64104 RepID=A0A2C3W5U8_9BACI|nr:hypothetical protein [Bacillus pseudomycoides]PDY44023.1 hypothetical protein CON79_27895 [Bacillus pseudomycoides]PEA80212.1 hypothetical protein CON99_29640 [Bacillus pseudomycoides]PEM65898.1 hypothetical protein CN613_23885 [Bacillus pseudomycoides]PFZ05931.1 hypothetical protein COL63_28080 [Bacillus pseudomycoides]PGC44916.1 hypothetical protein COM14_22815 [Bacillus pseudomycoides]
MKLWITLLLSFLLLSNLVGCTTQSNTSKTMESQETKKDTKASAVQFKNKEIKEIEITSNKDQTSKILNNRENVKTFVDGIHHAKEKSLSIDKEALSFVENKINVKFQDGSNQEYLVWVTDNETVVTLGEQTSMEQAQVPGYKLTDSDSKKLINLLKNK